MKNISRSVVLVTFSAFLLNYSVQAETLWNCKGNDPTPIEINISADKNGKITSYDFNGDKFDQNSVHPFSYIKKPSENESKFRFAISKSGIWSPYIYFEATPNKKNILGKIKNYRGHIELGTGYDVVNYYDVICKKIN